MKSIRYALIGAGMMGHEHIRNIALLPGSEITAICDPNDEMRASATELAASLGSGQVKSADAPENIDLASCADCIVIVSPNHTHVDVMKSIADLHKPVLVEKPVCTSRQQLDYLTKNLHQIAAPVWVAMEYRYMPPTSRFIECVHGGDIGQLHMISIQEHRFPFLHKVDNWNRFAENTGGTLVEKCCHYFDLMCLLAQATPTRVYASGGNDVNHKNESYNGRVPDIIDNAYAIVDFDSGIRAMLDLCMFADGADPQETITCIGDRGKLEVRLPGPQRLWPGITQREPELVHMDRVNRPPTYETIEIDEQLLTAGDHHGSTYYQHVKFAEVVRGQGQVEVSLTDGLRAVAMGLAAEESARTGQAVEVQAVV